ncbi:DUF2813 domain-containing protein [Shigella flexneri]
MILSALKLLGFRGIDCLSLMLNKTTSRLGERVG